jgi:hypothetical protein
MGAPNVADLAERLFMAGLESAAYERLDADAVRK